MAKRPLIEMTRDIIMDEQKGIKLAILVKTAKAKGITGDALEQKIEFWIEKLDKGEWIPGTPWNIPATHRQGIMDHFNTIIES